MRWHVVGASALLLCGNAGIASVDAALRDGSHGKLRGVQLRDVAAPLREVWLRFHEEDLCLGVDGIFVFQPRGLEVWCRIKDERNYQRLSAIVEPLRKTYRIDLYPTRADREKRDSAVPDDDPPPSFWTNAELRSYLRDPFFTRLGLGRDRAQDDVEGGDMDPELKRRLKLFGDQILEWLNKMVQLAVDLPSLADAAYGSDIIPDLRNRARAVCTDHSREVGKCASRLAESLDHALPRGSGNTPSAQPAKESLPSPAAPYEGALNVSQQAQDLERRILLFLYPQAHTVTLDDLREPSLIDSLKTLQHTVSDFESSARRAR